MHKPVLFIPPNPSTTHHGGEATDRWLWGPAEQTTQREKCLPHSFMKPHLDSRSNFTRYQHSGATVTGHRSFVENGKSQDARAVVLEGFGRKE